MANIPGNTEWVAALIPELEARKNQFVVDTDEVDDELIEVFIEELVRLSGELQQGREENDMEMVRMAAHSIKGMGGTIGLPEISVLGLEIENTAKEDRLGDADPLISGLAEWIKTLG
ncbi:Hpt domain-containing protein [Pontiellaceae bacterium B12227]|nr:Hpt domain-containing protein [Pontiellaceae bacterium B12227]